MLLGIVVLLGLLTWTSGDPDFRMAPVEGGVVLAALPTDTEAWQVRGPAGTLAAAEGEPGLVLSNSGAGRVVASLPVSLPSVESGDDGRALRIEGRFERLGPASFALNDRHRTRIYLRWADADGKRLGYGAVTRFEGQFRTRHFEGVTEVPSDASRAELVMVADRIGAWRFHEISVDAVEPAAYYPVVLAVLVLAWAAVFGWLFAMMLRGAPRQLVAALAGVLVVLVAGVALAQSRMAALLGPVTAGLATRLPEALVPTAQVVLKGGHAAGFGLLALLLVVMRRALGLGLSGTVALGLSLAFASEALQRHRPNRSANLGDVTIDAIGMTVALALWFAWSFLSSRRARVASGEQAAARS